MKRLARIAVIALSVAACGLAASCSYDPLVTVRPSPATSQPPSYVRSLGLQWSQTFSASFTGSKLDTSVWGTCYPWQSPDGCTNYGNANEYEWYLPSQDQVYGGALHLVPQRTPTQGLASDGAAKQYSYRSGMVTTYPSYQFQYGYVQVVARIPFGSGLWPALWLLPANKQWPPEIDIIEHYGNQAISYQHLHSNDVPTQVAFELTPNLSNGWHVFGLYWSQYQISWYIDGQRVFQSIKGIPQQSMYIIANLAIYQQGQQNWSANSDAMAVKSVTVWQGKSYPRLTHP